MQERAVAQIGNILFCLVLGEEPFSFGYGGTGKKSENCKFADFGERFGENDVIGCYIVSNGNCISIYLVIATYKDNLHVLLYYALQYKALNRPQVD